MIRRLISLAAFFVTTGCAPAPVTMTDVQRAAIADSARALVKSVMANFDKMDTDASLKDYSKDADARYMDGGSVYASFSAYRASQAQFAAVLEAAHTSTDSIDVVVLSPDAVVMSAPWQSTLRAKGRSDYIVHGAWSLVLQRRTGRWQVIHAHESIVNPDAMVAALTPGPSKAAAKPKSSAKK